MRDAPTVSKGVIGMSSNGGAGSGYETVATPRCCAGTSSADASGMEVFAIRRPELGVDWYDFAVHAVDKGTITATGGFTLRVAPSVGLLERADTIIVPGWRGLDSPVPAALLRGLRAAFDRGARITSVCSGAFVLAAAGLLDGRRATTHGRFAAELARRHPDVEVQPDALYVDEGQIVTAAGSASGLDMMLHLVRSDHGARVANLVAQRLVIPPHREGGQAQFVPCPLLPADSVRISSLLEWLRGNLKRQHSLASLAARASMSPRTLHRSFVDCTGLAPFEWLVRERVAYAKEILESKRGDMGRVAEAAGFGSEESLRRHFRRIAGTSPTAYRKQFLLTRP
jgi:AraC family transcriptional regulator, transcriptional activator FtrA